MATPTTQPALHRETVEALLRLQEERIRVVEIYGAGRMALPGRVTSPTGGCEEPAVRLTHLCTRVRVSRT